MLVFQKVNTFLNNELFILKQLPAKSMFTKLIFQHEHEILLRGDPQVMLSSIRLRYWPMNWRTIARIFAYRCVKCFKYRPTVMQPIMGELPKSRIDPRRALEKPASILHDHFMLNLAYDEIPLKIMHAFGYVLQPKHFI